MSTTIAILDYESSTVTIKELPVISMREEHIQLALQEEGYKLSNIAYRTNVRQLKLEEFNAVMRNIN